MYKIKYWMFLAGGVVIFALVGCSATPDEKQLQEWRDLEGPGEMKPGPGLFSGEDGKFTLYSSTKGGVLPKEGKAEAAQTSTRQTAETTEPTGAAAAAAEGPQAAAQQPAKTSATARDYQKFQEYQQWQKGARSAAEYKEFLEWKEFKAYQEWKKSQH